MKIRRAAIAAMFVIVSAAPAAADPVSSLVALIGSMLPAGFGGAVTIGTSAITLGQAVTAALFVGLTVVSTLFRSGVDPSNAKETFSTESSAELRAVGRVRIGGLKVFGNSAGYDAFRLVAHLRGPVSAIETTHLGGREVVVEDDGAVSSPPYAKYGGSWVYLWTKVGAGTETAWSALTAAFPTLWTADHRARGIFQTLAKYVSPGVSNPRYLNLYSGGWPDVERVVRAEAVYDPRDGAQDPDDATTWAWSDNGVLVAVHVFRSFPEITSDDLDWTRIAAEATRADALVDTLTGTEPRARAWGVWSSEENRGDVLTKVLDSIGAEIVETDDGKLAVALIDDERSAEMTIAARYIVDSDLEAGPESVERPNLCVVRYYAPERNYTIAEVDMTGIGWARIDAEIAATGEQPVTLDFPFCPSASQAQRLARRKFALLRAVRGRVTTQWPGLAAWGRRMVDLEIEALGETLTCAIEPPEVDDAAGLVGLGFVAWPVLPAWDPETMEAAAPEQIPEIPVDTALDQPDPPSALEPILYPDGSKAVRLAFDTDSGLTAEATIRTYTAGLPDPWVGMTEHTGTYDWAERAATDIIGVATVDARVRVFNADGDSSNWSDVETFTAPAYSAVAPSAPSIVWNSDDGKVVVTLPAEIRIAKLVTTGNAAPGTSAATPGGVVEWTPSLSSGANLFTAVVWTSNDLAASTTATLTVTV